MCLRAPKGVNSAQLVSATDYTAWNNRAHAELSQWLQERVPIVKLQCCLVQSAHEDTPKIKIILDRELRTYISESAVCALFDCLHPIILGDVFSELLFNRFPVLCMTNSLRVKEWHGLRKIQRAACRLSFPIR